MGDRGRRQPQSLIMLPRKRRTPLKRYKVLATLPGGEERVFLIIKARSKKNACFFAMQEYTIVKVQVIAVLGKAREVEDF